MGVDMMNFLLEEKNCTVKLFASSEQISRAKTGGIRFPLVFAFVGEYTKKLDMILKEILIPEIESGHVKPFVLALFEPSDWDLDYSPWYLKGSGGREFKGGLPKNKLFLKNVLLPYISRYYELSGKVYTLGYSLGGLAALYYYLELGFDGCASCSGSLWFPGFTEYCKKQIEGKKSTAIYGEMEKQQKLQDKVYFSLGGKEKNTKDALMCHIEENTKETYEQFKTAVKTVFVHEPGGHMCRVEQRLAHGLIWLFAVN